ncbi:MAG: tubulin-like doman-containing protein [Pseudomonadota bacterium]
MEQEKMYIVEDALGKPSEISPMLFVGLGGAGCRMVVRVARHLQKRADYQEKYKNLVKFALVDTNINDLEAYREYADETFLISDFEKEQYANLASGKAFLDPDDYFTQWVPQDYRFRAGDTAGAGQIRIESRLGCYYQMKHKDMVPRFRNVLERLKSHEHGHRRLDTQEIRVVICFSVAGGTGSGSHLPLAYMIADLARAMGRPNILGVAVLPSVFEDKTGANKDGTFANGYAALKEIEHMMKLGAPDSRFFPEEGRAFHYNPSDQSKRVVRRRPFEFLYIIDKPESFTVEDPVAAASDGLYLQLFSPLFGEQMGDYDNYTQHQRFLVPHDFEGKGIEGFSTFYGTYGAAVLLVPVDGLVTYCAKSQALLLMQRNILGDIPGDLAYQPLRVDRAPFEEVTYKDGEERPVRRKDFHTKESHIRARLLDRLFMKRVRLLAACEHAANESGRFLDIYRHGQRAGELPALDGTIYEDEADKVAGEDAMRASGLHFSLGAAILPAICGASRGARPGLLEHAIRKMKSKQEEEAFVYSERTGAAWLQAAMGQADDLYKYGRKILENGYRDGRQLTYLGFNDLAGLDFMKQAGEVSLTAKRYCVLSLIEEIEGMKQGAGSRPEEMTLSLAPDKVVKQKDFSTVTQELESKITEHALYKLKADFYDRLPEFEKLLKEFARTQREMDEGVAELLRQQARDLEDLRTKGDETANAYVLDGEALQIENGRRMWDFYYADRVADDPELGLGSKKVRQIINDSVVDISQRPGTSRSAIVEHLFKSLVVYLEGELCKKITGDPNNTDEHKRAGLTLSDALQLEVVYRALYLSNLEKIDALGQPEIRSLLATYNTQPPDKKLDLSVALHRDYLHDKIKRLVKEKAGLLCMYEESRDLQGGVRPDSVLLAAIDENFRNTEVERILRDADIPNLKWVTKGWHNPQEIVFYSAMLNVPLYVFGRMGEMKEHYYRFKGLAKRSKVLHIDKNWEETLPDLDPDTAQEKHRQALVRAHIVNFAALFRLRLEGDESSPIVHRRGKYYLRDPEATAPRPGEADMGYAVLGVTMAQAVERLPEVLEAERVKYLPYQQMLTGIRRGLAPDIIKDVAELPLQWRSKRDELRTQYGTNPTVEQREKLKDLTNAFKRLVEALFALLDGLRDVEKERQTMDEEVELLVEGANPADMVLSMRQSVQILETFRDTWNTMEHPETNREIPRRLGSIFRPMEQKRFSEQLDQLKRGIVEPLDRPAGGDEKKPRHRPPSE